MPSPVSYLRPNDQSERSEEVLFSADWAKVITAAAVVLCQVSLRSV